LEISRNIWGCISERRFGIEIQHFVICYKAESLMITINRYIQHMSCEVWDCPFQVGCLFVQYLHCKNWTHYLTS
jgi:hypothetical protein